MDKVSVKVLSMEGKEVGSLDLDPKIFGAKVKRSMVHEAVLHTLAKKRAGTHSALTKAEVSGGGKKPWKQKGTGNARAGSNTSPLWVGGGVSHGPKPRDYTNRFSKRAKTQALCAVLTHKQKKGGLKIVEEFKANGKTSEFAKSLKKLGLNGEKVLMINDLRAARNVPGIKIATQESLNAYNLLKYKYLLGTKSDFTALQERLIKQIEG